MEFCSDVFLLPLGSPPRDTLESDSEEEEGGPPPAPPPLDPALYEILMRSLDPGPPRPQPRPPHPHTKHRPGTVIEYSDNVEHFI